MASDLSRRLHCSSGHVRRCRCGGLRDPVSASDMDAHRRFRPDGPPGRDAALAGRRQLLSGLSARRTLRQSLDADPLPARLVAPVRAVALAARSAVVDHPARADRCGRGPLAPGAVGMGRDRGLPGARREHPDRESGQPVNVDRGVPRSRDHLASSGRARAPETLAGTLRALRCAGSPLVADRRWARRREPRDAAAGSRLAALDRERARRAFGPALLAALSAVHCGPARGVGGPAITTWRSRRPGSCRTRCCRS